MPKRYTPTARETVDLHASWWSDAKDPETGRYLERAVIYTKLLYADEKWLQSRVNASLADSLRSRDVDLSGIAEITDPNDQSQVNNMLERLGLSAGDLVELGDSQDDVIYRAVVEITDDAGTPLPWRDPNGNLLEAQARQTLGEMESADVKFILEELNARIKVQPVPILPADVQAAAIGDPAAANGKGAAGVAQAAFRSGGEPGLS